ENSHAWRFDISPDAKWLAISQAYSTRTPSGIRLIEVAGEREFVLWEGDPHSIRPVAFSPDSKLLAGQNQAGFVRVWSARSGKEVAKLDKIGDIDQLLYLTFSPDGRILAAANLHQTPPKQPDLKISYSIELWEVVSGKRIRTVDLGLSRSES